MISTLHTILWGLAIASGLIWLGLFKFRGGFWQSDQQLPTTEINLDTWPSVAIVIPARNEATVIGESLGSLLQQHYPGVLSIILVDDQSDDGTAAKAKEIAERSDRPDQLQILEGTPLPPGWSGKLWALSQGIDAAQSSQPEYILLTDADIAHSSDNLRQLVCHAETNHLAMVSLMVKLRCKSLWEKLLIPAFIFFFEKLYPFRWVNNPKRKTAAAAGGCILVRRDALAAIGGIGCIRDALIDDCSLAAAMKNQGYPIWLGLSSTTLSLRAYDSLETIWTMVARTAYTQLHYSPWLLAGTVLAMTLVYLVPPVVLGIGLLIQDETLMAVTGVTWILMAYTYGPTLRLYNLHPGLGWVLPIVAFMYTVMTLDSARRHWYGQGGAWKGRVYQPPSMG